jgi:lysophospholipase L1-like esterase
MSKRTCIRGISSGVALTLALATLPSPTVVMAVAQPVIHHIILGDSYSAGNGAGSYEGVNDCFRSKQNWGGLLSAKLVARGYKVDTQNWACNGAIAWDVDHEEKLQDAVGVNRDPVHPDTAARLRKRPNADDSCPAPDTSNPAEDGFAPGHFWRRGFPFHSECKYFLEPQINHLSSSTNLVTMTIGGNDLGFADVVGACFVEGLAGAALPCKVYVDAALQRLRDTGPDGLKARLVRVLSAVGGRIDPAGVVEYLGYPSLVGDVSIPQSEYPEAASVVRQGAIELEDLQRQVVAQLNAAPGVHPTYIFVPILSAFYGHEVLKVGSSIASPNPDRWFVAPGKDSAILKTWYHPNPKGHEEIARLANLALVTVPSRLSTVDRRALDMVMVIDTTGSMGPYIDGVKASAIATVNALDSVSASWRVAVVSYRDFPSRTFDPADFPASVILGFSSDRTAIINAVNSLVGIRRRRARDHVLRNHGGPWVAMARRCRQAHARHDRRGCARP